MLHTPRFPALLAVVLGLAVWAPMTNAACPNGPSCMASTNQCGGILVQWNPAANAEMYDVRRAPASNPTAHGLIQAGLTGTSYLDSTAAPGVGYVYYIQPRNDSIFVCPGGYGSVGPVSGTGMRPYATNGMTVLGTPFNGCGSFAVLTSDPSPFGGGLYRSLVNDFSMATRVASLASLGNGTAFATDNAAPAGVQLYYWARSEALCGNGPVSAVFPTVRSQATTNLISPAPVINSGQECGQVTVTWATVPGWQYQLGINTGTSFGYVEATPPFVDTFTNPLQPHTYVIRAHNSPCGFMADGPTVQGSPAAPGTSAIAASPMSLSVLSGAPALISATLTPTAAPTMLRWLREGQPVANSDRISGADTETLLISHTVWEDAGSYRLEVTNACGTGTSAAAVLAVRPACRADFDESGGLAVADIFTFLNAWFAGCP